MRPIPLLLAVFSCLFLSACVTERLCGTAEPGQPVYIEVGYAADGTPTVEPESCTVKQGVAITWQGPLLDDTPFRLTFDGNPGPVTKGTPVVADERASLISRSPLRIEAEGGSLGRRAGIRAENEGTYKYNVDANNRTLDPHIIIER